MNTEHLGDGTDIDKPEIWIKKFEKLARMNKWNDQETSDVFEFLMSGRAGEWYSNKAKMVEWTSIKKEFLAQFSA
ncbi:hypothetical protein BB561_003041 [Smittium simulii]|uniref:Retrotransposon gag domain-containing protein n=1 Tax=Smittium simulii TaxID=133385 RepID=A0A2T9YN83_9FUNG|nr:hypothetical protein BB561_003041 [Smittium simulii]